MHFLDAYLSSYADFRRFVPWCPPHKPISGPCSIEITRRDLAAVIKSAASAASPGGFQAVIQSAASAASLTAQKIVKKMKEKLPFWALYIGMIKP